MNNCKLKVFGIIPARYASKRFPGKPLALLGGRTMVEWVYRRASKAFALVVVATDDERIVNEVKGFGGNVVMTSPLHPSGTDRCAEALALFQEETGVEADVVVNIQGDEPFIEPELLTRLVVCFETHDTQIATVVKPFTNTSDVFNPNKVKVVLSKTNRAIYFSRSPIPYIRDFEQEEWVEQHKFYWHLGLYAYRANVLKQLTMLPPSSLEVAESLEQNRWLENDFTIRVIETKEENIAVDTPEDLVNAEKIVTSSKLKV